MAKGYKDDPAFRDRLLTASCPAKEDVRTEIFRVLREQSIPLDRILTLTEEVWVEDGGEVRSAGVVARCMAVSAQEKYKEQLVTKLCEEVESIGMKMDIRRRSALAGLLQLQEYAACAKAIADEKGLAWHRLAPYHDPDLILARMFFEHFEGINDAATAQSLRIELPWDAFISSGAAWLALTRSEMRKQLLQHIKKIGLEHRSPESLALMAELLPGSFELRTQLIESIRSMRADVRSNVSFEAQRILAEQFGGDEQALSEFVTGINIPDELVSEPEYHSPFLLALAIGWPDHPWLSPYLKKEKPISSMPLVTALAICGLTGDIETTRRCIDRLIENTIENRWGLPNIFVQSLRILAKMPHGEDLLRSLLNDGVLSHNVTATKLLAGVGKVTNKDRSEMVHEFNSSFDGSVDACPAVVDLVGGTVTTLPKAVFGLLTKEPTGESMSE